MSHIEFLLNKDGAVIGQWCPETGRAQLGMTFLVPERTCLMVDNGYWLRCSECKEHYSYGDDPSYCMRCGAKVVNDGC